jgi:hypothetical protein
MDTFLKITIVVVAIILAVLILFPPREYFENTLSSKSSVIYSNKNIKTDAEYLNALNTISNDLLIMYRCIEFKKDGIEMVINRLKTAKNFFVSNKYETTYTDFSTIEELIRTSILNLYDSSKEPKFYGPIYLLITQYPLYSSVSFNGSTCVRTVQSSPLENNFSPIFQTIDKQCENFAYPENNIKCEFYILMPSHLPLNNTVGSHRTDISWDTIKANMSDLFNRNTNINNERSHDTQCFTTCGEIQVDGYVCGARNGETPYKSIVFNTPLNNLEEKKQSDYANLYILNTNGINSLLKTDINIIEDGIKTDNVYIYPKEEPKSVALKVPNTNDSRNVIPHIDLAIFKQQQRALAEQRALIRAQRVLLEKKKISDLEAYCYLRRYKDLRKAFGYNSEKAKNHWANYGVFEKRKKECTDDIMGDGSTEEKAAPSAKYIMEKYGLTINGVYWILINLPNTGFTPTPVYCIMNPDCAGGGWMLAMKGEEGNTFHYESDHWKTATTLNSSNPSNSKGDAKYNVFNYYKANDWFAGFPDIPTYTGDVSRNVYNGFTWVENNAANSKETLLEVFSKNTRITKSLNPTELAKFNKSVWSSQTPFQFYGINYQGGNGYKSRWGFGWNENSKTDEYTNDAGGGIGTHGYSAGDHYSCCGIPGNYANSAMRFEFYVR